MHLMMTQSCKHNEKKINKIIVLQSNLPRAFKLPLI
jgi:hypothetical protein